MRKVDAEFGKDWWFKVWGPDKLAPDGVGSREDWMLRANEKWHGFGNLAPGFNMLDPIKATIITPGLDVTGKFAKSALRACLDAGTHAKAVQESVARIQKLNVNGTPMFLVGRTPQPGKPLTVAKIIEGAQPFEAFQMVIDEVANTK